VRPDFALLVDPTVSPSNKVECLERIVQEQARNLCFFDACPARGAAEAFVSEGKALIESIKYELEKPKASGLQ